MSKDMMFEDRKVCIYMFEDTEVCISKHTYSAALPGPVHIMRQTISNNDMLISPISLYHRYKGLSNIGYKGLANMNVWIDKHYMGGNQETTLDNKHSIYKHYMRDMADIKVWI